MITRVLTQITIAILFSGNIFAQDTLPNPDYEQWITNTLPKNWSSTNSLLPPGNIVCFQTTNSHTGNYAVQLKTIDLDGMAVPGVLTLGYVGMGFTAGGIAFTQKPVSLKGYIRHPSYGDEVMVIAEFYKNGNPIGSGFWSTTDSIGDYTEFVAPIAFQSTESPDTLNITIITDQNQVGSSLQIDALEFEYTTTSVKEKNSPSATLYPNPCTDRLFLSTLETDPEDILIYDLSGQKIHLDSSIRSGVIDVTALPTGIYIAELHFQDAVLRKKFIKQ